MYKIIANEGRDLAPLPETPLGFDESLWGRLVDPSQGTYFWEALLEVADTANPQSWIDKLKEVTTDSRVNQQIKVFCEEQGLTWN